MPHTPLKEIKDDGEVTLAVSWTKDAFDEHVRICKNDGFTIDPEENSYAGTYVYAGSDSENYRVEIGYNALASFITYSNENDDGDIEIGTTWPTVDIAKSVPGPAFSDLIGNIYYNKNSSGKIIEISISVAGITSGDFDSYVSDLKAAGFNKDIDEFSMSTTKTFSANNGNVSVDLIFSSVILTMSIEYAK